jgi:hypothetical protein
MENLEASSLSEKVCEDPCCSNLCAEESSLTVGGIADAC